MSAELRRFTHEERLSIGQQISGRVLDKYGDSVLVVYICGSTAKNLDRPYSDLEMIVVVRDGVTIPTKYYVHRGLVVEVDYPQESNFLKAARHLTRNWPMEADQYRNRIIPFERKGWTARLDQALAENEKEDVSEALRFAAVELTEDLSVLLNARITGDAVQTRIRGFAIAGEASMLVFLLNRRYVTTTSWYWKQVFECPWTPKDFERLVKVSAGFTPASPEEVAEAANQLCSEVMEMVRSRGISVEVDELVV
jgi:kanamycin nucleotidyltransferase